MPRKGEEHHLARLTADLVHDARALRTEGLSYDLILERLGYPCSRSALFSAVRGETWAHLDDEPQKESE
jgi:hypothetical protein